MTTDIAMRPLRQSLPMALLDARETAMQLFRPLLAEHDLTEQQWRVLRVLAEAEEPSEIGPLADRTSLLAPSMTRILANLEARNLVERRPVAHDNRRAAIALSPRGAALVREIAPRSESLYSELEAAFGTRRLERLIDELRDLADLHPGLDSLRPDTS